MLRPLPPPQGNRLLARLPLDEYTRLLRRLQPVTLKFKQVVYEARAPIDHAYFPIRGGLSSLIFMEDGNAIEVATTGCEGMVGLPAVFRDETSPYHVLVQIAGDALRMRADALKEEGSREGPFRRLLLRYQSAFLAQVLQGVACNGLHTVQQRCCRWLLMTHDRVQGDSFLLTHEFLAMMLGVRRASISEVLRPLQALGLIRSRRGKMTILDRDRLEVACCECYRTVEEDYARLLG